MPEPETGPAVTEPGGKPSPADVTVAEFRQAGERGDAERAIACAARPPASPTRRAGPQKALRLISRT